MRVFDGPKNKFWRHRARSSGFPQEKLGALRGSTAITVDDNDARSSAPVSDYGGEKMRKSFRRSRWLFTACAVVVLALVSSACGSGGGKTTTTISTTTTTKAPGY